MAKGSQYENQVADAIEAELAKGNYGIDPSCAVIRRKPGYFSRDRNKDIVFDVSIEVTRKGGTTPYWIWIWECKNYGHTVPVDDAEEFHAKLSQIGADRAKGTMITPVGFDGGTVEIARSKGIGLWRFIPPGIPVLVMEDSRGVADADILRGLTTPDPTKFRYYGDFYALTTSGKFTTDESELRQAEFEDVLDVPMGIEKANQTVRVVSESLRKPMTPTEWSAWVQSMAGSITDPTFERPPQLPLEEREPLS